MVASSINVNTLLAAIGRWADYTYLYLGSREVASLSYSLH